MEIHLACFPQFSHFSVQFAPFSFIITPQGGSLVSRFLFCIFRAEILIVPESMLSFRKNLQMQNHILEETSRKSIVAFVSFIYKTELIYKIASSYNLDSETNLILNLNLLKLWQEGGGTKPWGESWTSTCREEGSSEGGHELRMFPAFSKWKAKKTNPANLLHGWGTKRNEDCDGSYKLARKHLW